MIKILLLTDFSSGYGRNLLEGVVRYSREYGPWIFYRMPLYYRELHGDEGVVKWAEEWGADAIIAQLTDIDLQALNRLDIPIIVQNYKERYHGLSNLTGDYYGTGVMAAEFFIRKGYKSFAYYGFQDTVWMRERGEGFRDTVAGKGFTVYPFSSPEQRTGDHWVFDATKVSRWLLDLPKPLALFACDDYHALEITEVCKMYNIRIPTDIAILGVDNDNLLCNISDPALSSIELDITNGGYEVGKLLHQFIDKKISAPIDIIIKPVRIVTRGSTERFAVSDKYIRQVLEYMDDNYRNPISVDDLIRIIPISRRVLEKKFKSETDMSVYQYLQQLRIDKFTDFLITTTLPLVEAAAHAGFTDYKNFSRIFTKMKGITPLQYRKKYTTR